MNKDQLMSLIEERGYLTLPKLVNEYYLDGWDAANLLADLWKEKRIVPTTGRGVNGILWHPCPAMSDSRYPSQTPGWSLINNERVDRKKKQEREAKELEEIPEEVVDRETDLRARGIIPQKPEWVLELEAEEERQRKAEEEWDLG